MFAGKKTYIVVAATLAYALGGLYLGNVNFDQAVTLVVTALGLGGLRSAIGK